MDISEDNELTGSADELAGLVGAPGPEPGPGFNFINKVEYNGRILIDISDDTVDSSYVLSGETFHSRFGDQRYGNIPYQYAHIVSPSTSEQTVCPSGVYTAGAQKVAAVTGTLLASLDSDFAAGNIKKDVDLFGVVGTYEGSGGGSTDIGLVKFVDYDGSSIAEWPSSEVAGKSALPGNPSHLGLVAQGWNWTLSNIKLYISSHPNAILTVGQLYSTSSGLTEIDIELTPATGLTVNCLMSGTKNWGDGTTNTATSHTYSYYDIYTITCDGTQIPAGSSSASGMFGASASNAHGYYCTAIRLGSSVTKVGNYGFRYCYSLRTITIPSSMTSVGTYLFESCESLLEVTIPAGLTSIGNYGFQNCYSLESVALPVAFSTLGTYAFQACHRLTSIACPDSITSVGMQTFYECRALTSVELPSRLVSIGSACFQNCSALTSITIPSGVTSIANSGFRNCGALTEIEFPSGLLTLGTYTFYGCYSLVSITIPDSVTAIGNYSFQNCFSLKEVSLSSGMTTVSQYLFQNCYALVSVDLPTSITSISDYAFQNCYALTYIEIPSSVISIGKTAFGACYTLTVYDFSSANSVPSLADTTVFTSINKMCKIVVPDSLYYQWTTASNWTSYVDYIFRASEVGF